jgi:hypothetical protein
MTNYERMNDLLDKYQQMYEHFYQLNKLMCQLLFDLIGEGLTSPESLKQFQKLMLERCYNGL